MKMKRLLLILFCLCMVVALFACGDETPKGESSAPSTEQTGNPDSTDEKDTTSGTEEPKPEDAVSYDNWAKVGGKSIYVNYRDGRRKDEQTTSVVFHSNHTDMVALTYNKADEFTGGLADVFDFLNTGAVFNDVASYAEANFFDISKTHKIEKTSDKAVTIGELNAMEINGRVADANGRVCYAHGYTFVIEGVPCFLVGFVFTESQDKDMITAINTEVDTMIQTVRTER